MDFVPKNVRWLLPEEPGPCDIFLHFRGQYAVAIPRGQAASFGFLEKLVRAGCERLYIRSSDEPSWQEWRACRWPCPSVTAGPTESAGKKREAEALYGNKRAELLSYVQKAVVRRTESDAAAEMAFAKALGTLQRVVGLPALEWYFLKFHEPPLLFHHCGRVAFAASIFSHLHRTASEEEIAHACFAALIHELEGSPEENMRTVVSQQTLAILEKGGHPVPAEVTKLIAAQDELWSGKGFPDNKAGAAISPQARLFTLFNHFDTYRLRGAGTRRARFAQAREAMERREQDYDPALWPLFWHFWEKQAETVA